MYNANANFYFTLSRLFELGAGGLLAIQGRRYKGIANAKKEFLFSFGLILILLCAYTYWSDIAYHPGVTTLPVVMGSLLCIMYGDAPYAGSIVRNKVIVYLGKISYSVYLIHWPFIVFCKEVQHVEELTIRTQCILFIVSFLFASIMYHCVENNYRRISLSFFAKTGKIFVSLVILLFAINYVVYAYEGLPSRLMPYSKESQEFSMNARKVKEYADWESRRTVGAKNKNPIAIFVGDSYLGQYIEQIDTYFKRKNQSVLFISGSGCSESHIYVSTSESCLKSTKDYYNALSKQLPIILIENWSEHFASGEQGRTYNEELRHINATPQDIFTEITLQQKRGKNTMLFILPPPLFTKSSDLLGNASINKLLELELSGTIPYKSDQERVKANELMIQLISKQPNMSYIETYDVFCNNAQCSKLEPNSGIFYYSDRGHLSRYGAKLVWDTIGDQVYDFILTNTPKVK